MSYTKSLKGRKARHALLRGAKKVYDMVSTTLGPRGKNIIVNKGFDNDVLHDGVKVSRFVSPKDPFEKPGADILKEAAEKHVSNVGDGTTLTVILGYHIAKEAMTLIDSGVNAMSLRKGLETGRDILVDQIEKLSKKVKTKEDKINVATVSAHDPELGKMIGETYHKIGLEGVIVADDGISNETILEHGEGISLDKGYLSPYFSTNPRNMTAVVKDSYILITDRELDDVYEFLDFVEKVLKPKKIKKLTIIAGDVKGNLLASLIETKMKGLMSLLAVKAPAFGNYKKELLEDIAIMTGGSFIADDAQKRLDEVTFDDLGFASQIKASKDSTTIIGNKGDLKAIKTRISSIKHQIKDPDTEFDEEKLRERLSKMTGGVYVIRTGGATEMEMNERKERVEDAILATKSAIVSGIVPGGEVTFLKVKESLVSETPEEEYAFRILSLAIQKPFKKLLVNAGLNPGYFMAKLEDLPFGHGIDVTDGKVKDLVEEGIVDPTDVLTKALTSAVSVAVLLLTSDGVTAVINDDKKQT